MLDYANMAMQLKLHDLRLRVTETDISLCFLPLSHVFERAWSFFIMHSGAQNVYLNDTNLVRAAMQAVKPTMMCAVPRFYEKVYSAIYEKRRRRPGIASAYSTGPSPRGGGSFCCGAPANTPARGVA